MTPGCSINLINGKTPTTMKVCIFGGRDVSNLLFIEVDQAVIDSAFPITEVVSGGANGADQMGEVWAARNAVPTTIFKADWNKYARSAGMIRNKEMADYCEAGIGFWDGQSRGTRNMIAQLKKLGKPCYIFEIKPKA